MIRGWRFPGYEANFGLRVHSVNCPCPQNGNVTLECRWPQGGKLQYSVPGDAEVGWPFLERSQKLGWREASQGGRYGRVGPGCFGHLQAVWRLSNQVPKLTTSLPRALSSSGFIRAPCSPGEPSVSTNRRCDLTVGGVGLN